MFIFLKTSSVHMRTIYLHFSHALCGIVDACNVSVLKTKVDCRASYYTKRSAIYIFSANRDHAYIMHARVKVLARERRRQPELCLRSQASKIQAGKTKQYHDT